MWETGGGAPGCSGHMVFMSPLHSRSLLLTHKFSHIHTVTFSSVEASKVFPSSRAALCHLHPIISIFILFTLIHLTPCRAMLRFLTGPPDGVSWSGMFSVFRITLLLLWKEPSILASVHFHPSGFRLQQHNLWPVKCQRSWTERTQSRFSESKQNRGDEGGERSGGGEPLGLLPKQSLCGGGFVGGWVGGWVMGYMWYMLGCPLGSLLI